MQQRVVIAGGGLAGLAAAVALAERGLQVTLLEARPRWGGRASSFVDQSTGEVIDNCQHVTMGCCTNFRHFCETVGLAESFEKQETLWFVGPGGEVSRFAATAGVPAPFHLLPAFARLPYLTWGEKIRLAWGLRSLARWRWKSDGAGESFEQWLKRHGQPPRVIERFWQVVLVSALSETLDRIDVGHARKVFVDGFLAHRQAWEVWIPRVPLDELYGTTLVSWLTDHHVTPRLQAGVKRVRVESGRVTGVELRHGETVAAEWVILALPSALIPPLLPEELRQDPQVQRWTAFETAPITGVHLWFDREITRLPHATLVGRYSQWLFRRPNRDAPGLVPGGSSSGELSAKSSDELSAELSVKGGSQTHFYYQVVISASREAVEQSGDEVIAKVVGELRELFPEAREARLVHARAVTEHKAVLSMLPGIDALRPTPQSPLPNLFWAGDWTRTGWPGTMEGAVRSGYQAAEQLLREAGRPEQLLQPDLPVARWSRLLFGL